jgi:hypothetical protein
MTALVSFSNIKEAWQPSAGTFELLFAGIYELYLDKTRAPDIAADLRYPVGRWLAHCWPERYPGPEDGALPSLFLRKYPTAQKKELLRATQSFLRDLENDRVDPRYDFHPNAKGHMIASLREFIELMKQDLAPPPP